MSRYVNVNDVMNLINTSNRGNCDYFIVDQIEELCMSEKTIDEQQVRAKAIDEFAERMSLEISESIIGGMLFDNRDNSSYDTADKIVDYVVDTAKKIADEMRGAE